MRILNIWTIFWFWSFAGRVAPTLYGWIETTGIQDGFLSMIWYTIYGFIFFYTFELLFKEPSFKRMVLWFIIGFITVGVYVHTS